MPGAITIRTARHEDMPEMSELLRILFSIENDFSIDPEKQRRGLEAMLDGKSRTVFVAQIETRVVGMCSGQLNISTAEGAPSVLIEDVVVLEDWRGKGIGKELIHAVRQWAEQNGATRMQLLADRNNSSALKFYSRMGWERTNMVCLAQRILPEERI